MEPVSAAQAMEWSIDFEKSLRAKRRVSLCNTLDAISKLERRLVQWSCEPEITVSISNMFDLIPGEERLFANAVLSRIVDAFMLGDRQIRLSVTKLFLSEMKTRSFLKTKQYKGLLSKMRVHNPSEHINGIRTVFDSGNLEDKCMALTVLGCWADFAIDSPHVRYLILSSMISSEITEFRASLFAAGCFCELSDDFSYVLVEMLINLMSSPDILVTFKIIGARSFAKFTSSYTVADKAFQGGLKLALDSPEENLKEAFLLSLSKLAMKWFVLMPRQAEFILSFLGDKKLTSLKSISVRCLQLLFSCGRPFTLGERGVSMVSSIVDDSSFPARAQCDALLILRKLLEIKEPCLSSHDMPEYGKLIEILRKSSVSTSMKKCLLSINMLIDTLAKTMRNSEMNLVKVSSSEVLDLLLKNLGVLGNAKLDNLNYFEEFLVQIVRLVKADTSLVTTVLENLIFLCRHSGDFDVQGGERLILALHKFLVKVVDVVIDAGVMDLPIVEMIILLADSVTSCQSYKTYLKVIFSAFCHSQLIWSISAFEDNIHRSLSEQETCTATLVTKMINERDNWGSFKAGKCAALCGSWDAAAVIFEHLASEVHSHIYVFWLKTISQYAHSEINIHRLRFSTVDGSFMEPEQLSLLEKAHNHMRSSFEILETASSVDALLNFQIWFLSARAKLLGIMAGLIKNLNCVFLEQNESEMLYFTLRQVVRQACELEHLADEFDLISTSFTGTDLGSKRIISDLALICSIMALAASFSLFVSTIDCEQILDCSDRVQRIGVVLRSITARLSISCQTITRKFHQLLENPGQSINTSSESVTRNAGVLMGKTIPIADFVVSWIIELRNFKGNGLQATIQGFKNLLTTMLQMIRIPIQLPLCFFNVRRSVGAELFMLNVDNKNKKDLMIFQGSQMSVNICVQLRNLLPDGIFVVDKLYTVVLTKSSFENRSSERHWVSGETDTLIEMNKKLRDYTVSDRVVGGRGSEVSQCMTMDLHNRWQSFSSCLLDVSAFPVGSYQIKWLCCCVDTHGTYWTLLPLNDGPSFTVLARTA